MNSTLGSVVPLAMFGVNTRKTSCLSTLFEVWQCSTAGTSPPVHCRQLGSHENVSQVGWSQVRHHWSSRHPLLHCGIPLHQKIAMLVQNARGVRQSSVKGERQDDWPLLLWPHNLLHYLLPRPHKHRLELEKYLLLLVRANNWSSNLDVIWDGTPALFALLRFKCCFKSCQAQVDWSVMLHNLLTL